jgi:hypothetical protein
VLKNKSINVTKAATRGRKKMNRPEKKRLIWQDIKQKRQQAAPTYPRAHHHRQKIGKKNEQKGSLRPKDP